VALQSAFDVTQGIGTDLSWAKSLGIHETKNALLAIRDDECGTRVFLIGSSKTATEASLWRVYSVTKTFVAVATLSLVKEGKLTLDDPLSKWVHDVAGTAGVTIEMLLDHRSGIYDYLDDPEFDPSKHWTPRQLVDFATSHGPNFPPDESFAYSNTDYVLLGMILEEVTGQKAGAVLHERAIDPAGLHATLFDGFDAIDPARMARGFSFPHDVDVTFKVDPSVTWTAGGMVATGADLVAWVATLYGSDAILDPAQHALLSSKTSEFSALGPGASYGLGTIFNDAGYWQGEFLSLGSPGPSVGHWGEYDGYTTAAFWFPEKRTAIVSIVNAGQNDGFVNAGLIEGAAITVLFGDATGNYASAGR
jgi:D-alanyl-D-alanine carboxypeptidase